MTPWNAGKMRDAIINGPENHPGALSFADRISTVKLPSGNGKNIKKIRMAISRKLPSSRGAMTQSGRNDEYEFEGKVVYRHLQDGDIVLVNRQVELFASVCGANCMQYFTLPSRGAITIFELTK